MYSPPPGKNYDFIEFKNVGAASLDLTDIQLQVDDTLAYEWWANTFIAPQGFSVVGASQLEWSYWYQRIPDGNFVGFGLTKCSNLSLVFKPTGDLIGSVPYCNTAPWPVGVSSVWLSIVPIDPNAALSTLGVGSAWRASSNLTGSPWADDPTPPTPSTTSGTSSGSTTTPTPGTVTTTSSSTLPATAPVVSPTVTASPTATGVNAGHGLVASLIFVVILLVLGVVTV